VLDESVVVEESVVDVESVVVESVVDESVVVLESEVEESVVVDSVLDAVLVALEVELDELPRPRATDETHWPWLLTDGLCGFVAVQVLRATEDTVDPWLSFPFPWPFPLPLPPFACVGESPPTKANAQAIRSATAIDRPS
jgi:hypothetical protein